MICNGCKKLFCKVSIEMKFVCSERDMFVDRRFCKEVFEMFILYFEIDFVKGYIRYNYVNFFVVFRFNVFFEDFDFFE